MNRIFTTSVLIFILVSLPLRVLSQHSTMGKDFILSLGNVKTGSNASEIKIATSDNLNTTVTFTFHGLPASNFTTVIPPGSVYTRLLNDTEIAALTATTTVGPRSISIQSDNEISVYAMNTSNNLGDATIVLPYTALGKGYTHQSRTPSSQGNNRDGYVVVATENGTTVWQNGGNPRTMNAGDSWLYQFTSGVNGTGTVVESDKPIAYFVCNEEILLNRASMVFEQLSPTIRWGTIFIAPTEHQNDRVIIVASEPCTVTYWHTNASTPSTHTFNAAGESYELTASANNSSFWIESSGPAIGVTTLLYSCPAMSRVPSVQQAVNSIMIAPSSNTSITQHYAIIATTTQNMNATRMGIGTGAAQPLSGGSWITCVGNPNYSYYVQPLTNLASSYTFQNSAGVLVWVYGTGSNNSYYYVGGSATRELKNELNLNGIGSLHGNTFCFDMVVNVNAELTWPLSSISPYLQWYLDGVKQDADDQFGFVIPFLENGSHTLKLVFYDALNTERTLEATFDQDCPETEANDDYITADACFFPIEMHVLDNDVYGMCSEGTILKYISNGGVEILTYENTNQGGHAYFQKDNQSDDMHLYYYPPDFAYGLPIFNDELEYTLKCALTTVSAKVYITIEECKDDICENSLIGTINVLTRPTCNNSTLGSIRVEIFSEPGHNYAFAVNNVNMGSFTGDYLVIQDLQAGNYTVTVRDVDATCYSVSPTLPLVNIGVLTVVDSWTTTDVADCSITESGVLDVTVIGALGYTYRIDKKDGTLYYQETTPQQSLTFTYDKLSIGEYELTIFDPNGCAAPAGRFIIGAEIFNPVTYSINGIPGVCGTNTTDGKIKIEVSHAGSYFYILDGGEWTPFEITTSPNGFFEIPVTTGLHTIRLKIDDDCISSLMPVLITNDSPDIFEAEATGTTLTTCGLSDGTIILKIDKPGTYDYDLGNGMSGTITTSLPNEEKTIENVPAGSFDIVIKSKGASSCPYSFHIYDVEVRQGIAIPIPTPLVSRSNNGLLCIGGNVLLRVTNAREYYNQIYQLYDGGTVSYQWYLGGTPIQGANDSLYLATAFGNYTVQVTVGYCSVFSANIVVTNNPMPVATPNVSMSNDGKLCIGGNVLLSVVNAHEFTGFQWYDSDYTPILNETKSYYLATTAGTYYVEAIDVYCSVFSEGKTVVDENGNITLPTIESTGNILCDGGKILLYVTNTAIYDKPSYQWYKNYAIIPAAKDSTYWVLEEGIYTVQVTEGECSAFSLEIEIEESETEIEEPIVTMTNNGKICPNTVVVLTVTNDTDYTEFQWYNDKYVPIFNATNPSYTATKAGTYFLRVKNDDCTIFSKWIVTDKEEFADENDILIENETICTGETVTLEPESTIDNPTFRWYISNTATDYFYQGAIYTTTPLTADTTLFISVFNDDYCENIPGKRKSVTITVTPDNTITVDTNGKDRTLCINTELDTNIIYNTTGATGATVTGLPAGMSDVWASNVLTISGTPTTTTGSPFTYTVRLTGGCGNITETGTITVNTPPTKPTEITSSEGYTICTDTEITLTAEGGTEGDGATYEWGTGACGSNTIANENSSTLTIIPDGTTTYWVRRVGTAPCGSVTTECATQEIKVYEPVTPPEIYMTNDGILCGGDGNVLLYVTNKENYTGFQWYDATYIAISGENNFYLIVTVAGTYYVEVTDTNCSVFSDEIKVESSNDEIIEPKVSASFNGTICEDGYVILSLDNADEYDNPTFQWYKNYSPISGAMESTLKVTEKGVYVLEVIEGGCSVISEELKVNEQAGPSYTVTYNGTTHTDGTVPTDDEHYCPNSEVIVLGPNTLEKESYKFIGWATSATAITPDFYYDDVTSTFDPATFIITKDTILYAVWEQIAYTIIYNPNGAGGGYSGIVTHVATLPCHTIRGSEGLLFPPIDKPIFHGWNTKADGTGTTYKQGDCIIIDKDTAFYALWKSITCEDAFVGTIKVLSHPSCNGLVKGSIYVDIERGSGGYDYSINGEDKGFLPNDGIIDNLDAGNYTIVVYDVDNLCYDISQTLALINKRASTVLLEMTPTNATDCSSDDGELEITVKGSMNYTYIIDGGLPSSIQTDTTITIYNIPVGDHELTIVDETGCEAPAGKFTIAATTFDTDFDVQEYQNSDCTGTKGVILLEINTGNADHYRLDNGLWTRFIENEIEIVAPAGLHTIELKEGNCISTPKSVTITNNDTDAFICEVINTTPTSCGFENGTITLEINPPGTYSFTLYADGTPISFTTETDGTFVIDNLSAGIYKINVRNTSDCEFNLYNVAVLQGLNDIIAGPSAESPQEFCVGSKVKNLQAQGYNVKWYDSGNNFLEGNELLENGTYYVVQTNFEGCEGERTAVTVKVKEFIIVDAPNIPARVELCDPATLADIPTNGNTNIVWFDRISGGTELPLSTTIVNGGSYYASIKFGDGSCYSVQRKTVLTIVNEIAPPNNMKTPQHFCPGVFVANLAVPNDQIAWYLDAVGGTPLKPYEKLTTRTYYAAQKAGGCESIERIPVSVVIDKYPAPIALPKQTVCNKTVYISDLEVLGSGIKWFYSATGDDEITNPSETIAVFGETYYAAQISGDCQSDCTPVLITEECYHPIGTVFPFVHTGDAAFDAQFVITAKLYLVPPDEIFDKIKYLYIQNPVQTVVAEYYDCNRHNTIIGAPKNPGSQGNTNNPGLPIDWIDKGIIDPGIVNTTTLTSIDSCTTSPMGMYQFVDVAPGTYILELARQGFLPRYAKITIASNDYLGHRELLGGDVNGDTEIDDKDLSAFSTKRGSYTQPDTYNWIYDLTGNKLIDSNDQLIINGNLGAKSTIYLETKQWLSP